MPEAPLHLVTGATGYVGSRLVAALLRDGRRVRVLVRDFAKLPDETWTDDVDVVEGDIGDPDSLTRALEGVHVAYYLVHAMSDGDDYADVDRGLATAFAATCADAGASRIVYLGGLHPEDVELTEHLESRREVGDILLASGVPTAALQAGMVIGAGSASFEMLRLAATASPIVVGPSWLERHVQPIAIDDLVHYLVAAADLPAEVNRTFDLGGPDALSYRDLLAACADAIGRRSPPVVTVPVLLPHTTSYLTGLVAPGSTSLVTALTHSLSLDMVCLERDIADHVPEPEGGLTGVDEALRLACAAR